MGLLGDLISAPIRILEVPAKIIDRNIIDTGVSDALDDVADDLEEIDED